MKKLPPTFAISVYDSKQTRELQMPELIDEYFKIRSKVGELKLKQELRDFAAFLRSKYDKGSEINVDTVDAREVHALFLAGAAMFVDPPESKTQRGGDYLSKPYTEKKKELIGDFKTAVETWSTNSNEQTLKAVYASIMDVANMVPQQLLVCADVSTYKRVLRFFLGTAAASRNLVATALSGVAGIFGRAAKTTVGEFASVLEDPSLPHVMEMLLKKLGDATDTMHRVCNACFLYFVTHITDFDSYKDLLFGIRFMYPIMRASGNEDLHKRVQKTSEEVLESFCTGPFSHSEEEGFVYYDVFPSFGILWHELVSGLMARHYCCVLLHNDQPFNFDKTCYSVNQLLTESEDKVRLGIAEKSLSFDYDFERDCAGRLPDLKRRPYNEADHVALFGFYHGSIRDKLKNVTVPNNVTMVVTGQAGRFAGTTGIDFNCDRIMNDLHVLSNNEFYHGGCEIVPCGAVYPNLHMKNVDKEPYMGLFGCKTDKSIKKPKEKIEHLIPNTTRPILLNKILEIVSNRADKSGQMALLFISGCQSTDLGEKVSVGTDATYQAINILPNNIKVVSFDRLKIPAFDVRRVIQESLNKRKKQHEQLMQYRTTALRYDKSVFKTENVFPDKRIATVKKAVDRRWNSSTRIPDQRGGSLGCRPGVPFWTLVVVTVLAALAPELMK